METKHTSGPWIDNGEGLIVCRTGDIAEVFNKNDAPLIAAAPELLETLTQSLAAMERMDALLLKLTNSPKECEKGEIVRARAAIAKATGK